MNVPGMKLAIAAAGFAFRSISAWPAHGIVRIQFGGTFLALGVPPAAACQHTHWVASKRIGEGLWIFDVNGGWLELDGWGKDVVPRLVASSKRRDGTWSLSHSWEVRKATA